jgi:aquaporin Z
MNPKALVAEFVGTFALIFVGVGSIAAAASAGGGLVGVALAHGITIAVMASACGAISGGHFNPAVSFGAWIGHKIQTKDLIGYWIAQIAGGVVGAWLINYCIFTKGAPAFVAGTPALTEGATMMQGLVLEAVGTFFLVFVVYGTAIDRRAPKMGALFIGLTITAAILCFGPVTGCSINPARYLGPAIVNGPLKDPIVYIIGPLIGATIAALVYNYFLAERDPDMPVSELAP